MRFIEGDKFGDILLVKLGTIDPSHIVGDLLLLTGKGLSQDQSDLVDILFIFWIDLD
jgi:hypothetical protein